MLTCPLVLQSPRQDGNFKKLGQKLLLSRLKQNAIRSQLEDPDATSSRGGFTSTFIPPSEWGYDRKPASSRELAAAVNVNNTAPDDTPDIIDTNDGVEWEDGYTEMGPGKVLAGAISDEENSVDSGDEVDWVILGVALTVGCILIYIELLMQDLPVNTEEIDVNVLASLPTQMRKDLIEAARRRERARRRSNYMPVAANPDLYSQTQVANFLRTRFA